LIFEREIFYLTSKVVLLKIDLKDNKIYCNFYKICKIL